MYYIDFINYIAVIYYTDLIFKLTRIFAPGNHLNSNHQARIDSRREKRQSRRMAVIDITELAGALPPRRALLGLDLGEKTIGVAVSDISLTIASPLELIKKSKFTLEAERLFKLMALREADGLVIGLPVNMDGTEGPRCQSCRAFARNLLRLRDMPIAFWDERWSSSVMNRFLIEEADLTRAKRAEVIDRSAAAYILQGALDRMKDAAYGPL
jgi:putative Holliday junction resolvase